MNECTRLIVCLCFLFFLGFLRPFKSVIMNISHDSRCDVHQMLLGIREGKESWLELYSPGNSACDDDGKLWGLMVSKSFISNLMWLKLYILMHDIVISKSQCIYSCIYCSSALRRTVDFPDKHSKLLLLLLQAVLCKSNSLLSFKNLQL